MAIGTISCHVLQASVTRVTDLEGKTTRLMCPEFEEKTGLCRLKKDGLTGGPLSQLITRASEGTLGTRSTRCDVM